jgi:predicted nucleic acid-binding protein
MKAGERSMAFKVFLDANILLDITLQRPGVQHANAIFRLSLNKSAQLFTTPAIIHITSYYTSQQLTKEQTKQAILIILNDVEIIDCDHETTVLAVRSHIDDIEDALQYYTALKHKLDYFISSDKKLRKASLPQLPVVSASGLLAELENQ